MARRKDTIVLTDPRALRALAHPARQRLVDELFNGRVLTATEAAEMVDLTPSAVSHHLRALEKWGLARRAAATGDGRERPWEATGSGLNIEPPDAAGSIDALNSVIASRLRTIGRQLDAYIRRGRDPWKKAYRGMMSGELWLTEEETREVTRTMTELLEGLEQGRGPDEHPPGARHASYAWTLIPLEQPPEGY